jgi:hypothetical protein
MTDKQELERPSRYIYNDVDHEAWKDSALKQDLLRVVGAFGKSCAHAKFHFSPEEPLKGLSPAMASLRGSLEEMLTWMDEIPPLESSGNTTTTSSIRFGNPAFQEWHLCLQERSASIVREMHQAALQESKLQDDLDASAEIQAAFSRGKTASQKYSQILPEDPPSVLELSSYLHDAFGHPVRLDYGTGHESSFMIFLYGACKLGWLDEQAAAQEKAAPSMEKLKAAALSVFSAYLKVTRQLQTIYRLEPAGSHGVWGLDDYHCLPFYFGACQCQSQQEVDDMPEPSDITQSAIRDRYASTLMYFGCMEYICELKKGVPLFECSPMLYDISQTCHTWSKVASGLLRLYEGEVLNKRQVVQHFTFGQHLFVASWIPSQAKPTEAPTTNFRTDGAVAPMVRAPWADNNNSSGKTSTSTASSATPTTKAPWAK